MEEIDRLAYVYAVKEFPKGNTGKYFNDCMKDFKNGMLQGEKHFFSKSQVIALINKFNDEVTIGGKSELKDKYIGSLTYPELQQKWIEDNV